jgi:hypothetical protein
MSPTGIIIVYNSSKLLEQVDFLFSLVEIEKIPFLSIVVQKDIEKLETPNCASSGIVMMSDYSRRKEGELMRVIRQRSRMSGRYLRECEYHNRYKLVLPSDSQKFHLDTLQDFHGYFCQDRVPVGIMRMYYPFDNRRHQSRFYWAQFIV